jgi:hypothetical protein
MNQKVVVYIILSAILLYLYYKRGDIAIFAAFVVVVAGALFAGAREGMNLGGGDKGDKECAKMGFTAPKINKKEIKGGITKAMKNIQKVANKYWQFEDYGGDKPIKDKATEHYSAVTDNINFKTERRKIEKSKEELENSRIFLGNSLELYELIKNNEKIDESITKISDNLANGIKGGNIYLSLLKKNHIFLAKEYKAGGVEFDKDVKNLSQYLICLCTQWLSIWKQIQKAKGSGGSGGDKDDEGGDDGGDDEEEKPKKKNTKATKKKKSKKDDEGAADEDDE